MPYFERERSSRYSDKAAISSPKAKVELLRPQELVELATQVLVTDPNVVERVGGGSAVSKPVPAPQDAVSPDHLTLLRCCVDPQAQRSSASATFKLTNDGATAVETSVIVSDLWSERGDVLPRSAVSIEPASLRLAPGAQCQIELRLILPLDRPKGAYVGVVRLTTMPETYAVFEVQIL